MCLSMAILICLSMVCRLHSIAYGKHRNLCFLFYKCIQTNHCFTTIHCKSISLRLTYFFSTTAGEFGVVFI